MHVYCGLTRVLVARRLSSADSYVRISAHATYSSQACAKSLIGRWQTGMGGLGDALDSYFAGLVVNPRFINREGEVQAKWSGIVDPWVPFDREGVLGCPHKSGIEFPEVQKALDELRELSSVRGWPGVRTTGREIDQLGVDSEGRLVVIELKDASKRSTEVYYSPFQLLQYIWEWGSELEDVLGALQKMVDARKRLGLAPANTKKLNGKIRPVIGFGADTRSSRVRERYETVLKVVNRHLPEEVGRIESWECRDNGPRRIV